MAVQEEEVRDSEERYFRRAASRFQIPNFNSIPPPVENQALLRTRISLAEGKAAVPSEVLGE
jgi:hypothetical protein